MSLRPRCAVSRAVYAEAAATRQMTAPKTATGNQPEPFPPASAAAIVGANPPRANPIWVPIAMPESRTLAGNISP